MRGFLRSGIQGTIGEYIAKFNDNAFLPSIDDKKLAILNIGAVNVSQMNL